MKISIIVPVYNVEDYLRDCIESVICQTYQDFELILVDDGSTDDSGAICDEYAVRYSKQIKVIHKNNDGVMQARIDGIREARGSVLIFLDSDDTIRNDALARIASSFETTNCQMLVYNAEKTERFSSISIYHPFLNGEIFDTKNKKILYENLIKGTVANVIWNKAISVECIKIPEHFKNYRFVAGEDLLLSVCFLNNCNKIVFIEDGLYHYRDRVGSAIHSYNIRRKESIKGVHIEIARYIDQWGMPELKPLHSIRKVRGWINNLLQLLKCKSTMSKKEFKRELKSMAEDSYFRDAYKEIEISKLSKSERILAWCLYRKWCFLIELIYRLKNLIANRK